jgi:hypothetical protein
MVGFGRALQDLEHEVHVPRLSSMSRISNRVVSNGVVV